MEIKDVSRKELILYKGGNQCMEVMWHGGHKSLVQLRTAKHHIVTPQTPDQVYSQIYLIHALRLIHTY